MSDATRYEVLTEHLSPFIQPQTAKIEVVKATDHAAVVQMDKENVRILEATVKKQRADYAAVEAERDALKGSMCGWHREEYKGVFIRDCRVCTIQQQAKRIAKLEHRLEIDTAYGTNGKEITIPPDKRDEMPDGIICRDETIKLLEERIAALEASKEADFEVFHQLRLRLTEACGDPYKMAFEALETIVTQRDQARTALTAVSHVLRATRDFTDHLRGCEKLTAMNCSCGLDLHGAVSRQVLADTGMEGR